MIPFLKGYNTYIGVTGIAVLMWVKVLGWVTEEQYGAILGVLTVFTGVSARKAMNGK